MGAMTILVNKVARLRARDGVGDGENNAADAILLLQPARLESISYFRTASLRLIYHVMSVNITIHML